MFIVVFQTHLPYELATFSTASLPNNVIISANAVISSGLLKKLLHLLKMLMNITPAPHISIAARKSEQIKNIKN